MRPRLAALLLLALLALPLAAPAGAQEERTATVELSLVDQTPAATPRSPLRVEVLARHLAGPPIRDLTVSLWVYHPANSRSAYHAGLDAEPPTEPLLIAPQQERGPLRLQEERRFQIERRLPELAEVGQNALYPIKVQLESEGVAMGQVRSAVLFVNERPLVPLNLSVTFVLDPEIRYTPDGTLLDDTLEEAVRPGGSLDTIISALEDDPVRSTLAVSPRLLEWLERMGDGYRVDSPAGARHVGAGSETATLASEMLERLRGLARSTLIEVLALPYASPSIPSLVASGLEEDLHRQIAEGERTVQDLLGVGVATGVLRPPGSTLDRDGATALGPSRIHTVVLDEGTVPPPVPEGWILSPLATTRLTSGIVAIVPDETAAEYLAPAGADPELRAAQLLGELSALYLEQPSVLRGAAIVIRDEVAPPAELLRPLLAALGSPPQGAGWLRPVKATQLTETLPPETAWRLPPSNPPTFSEAFVERLHTSRRLIDEFEAMAGPEVPLSERLRRRLLAAQARRFATDQAGGLAFVRSVTDTLSEEFSKIEAPPDTSVTLTSHGGVIPLTLRSQATYPVRIRITLRSSRLDFLEGSSREIVLENEAHSLTFPVRAQTTGRFPVRVLLDTPGGRRIGESQMVVRSTAYNRVALLVTIGAAAFLAMWWGRRLLRRTTS